MSPPSHSINVHSTFVECLMSIVSASLQQVKSQPLYIYIYSGTCTFEGNSTCGWKDNSQGSYKWGTGYQGTPSDGTGPSTDHTLQNSLVSHCITLLDLKNSLVLSFKHFLSVLI